jgi:hypothetical protein
MGPRSAASLVANRFSAVANGMTNTKVSGCASMFRLISCVPLLTHPARTVTDMTKTTVGFRFIVFAFPPPKLACDKLSQDSFID